MPLDEETKEEGDACFYNDLILTLPPGIKARYTHTNAASVPEQNQKTPYSADCL